MYCYIRSVGNSLEKSEYRFDCSQTTIKIGFAPESCDVLINYDASFPLNFVFEIICRNRQYFLLNPLAMPIYVSHQPASIEVPLGNHATINLKRAYGAEIEFVCEESTYSSEPVPEPSPINFFADADADENVSPASVFDMDGFETDSPPSTQADVPFSQRDGMVSLSREYLSPNFTAYHPAKLKAGVPSVISVYVHIKSAVELIDLDNRKYAALMGDSPTSETSDSLIDLVDDTNFTLHLDLPGCQVGVPEQNLTWEVNELTSPKFKNTLFPITLTESFKDNLIEGQVTVFREGIVHGVIPIKIANVDNAPKTTDNRKAQLEKFTKVFASYAHDDRSIMEYIRSIKDPEKEKMLVDVYELRSGDNWSKRLLELIDEAEVFQLFWSSRSANSQYCEMEWRHALSYAKTKASFIQPVWWQAPMANPPKQLQHLHFTKIDIPVIEANHEKQSKGISGFFKKFLKP